MQASGRMSSVLVGLVWLYCMALAGGESKVDRGLIFETEIKEQLTREEMYTRLNSGSLSDVARTLSLVMNKKSTRVTGGLSVEKLLAQNEISTSQCTRRSLRMRVAVCERTKNFTKINLYCRQCLVEAVKFCLDNLDDAITEGLVDGPDRDLLLSLSSYVTEPHLVEYSQFGSLRTPLEQLVASSGDLERAGSI